MLALLVTENKFFLNCKLETYTLLYILLAFSAKEIKGS